MSEQVLRHMVLVDDESSIAYVRFQPDVDQGIDVGARFTLTPNEWAGLGSPREVTVTINAIGPSVHYDATNSCTWCDAEAGKLCVDSDGNVRSTPHINGGRNWQGADWSQGVTDSRDPSKRIVSAPTDGATS